MPIKLFTGNAEIPAHGYWRLPFRIPPGASEGHVTGEFHAFGGTGNDIEAAIATPSEYENWINGHEATTYYSTPGKVTNGQIDVLLPQGDYVLGFNNQFAAFSRKEVTGEITVTLLVGQP